MDIRISAFWTQIWSCLYGN